MRAIISLTCLLAVVNEEASDWPLITEAIAGFMIESSSAHRSTTGLETVVPSSRWVEKARGSNPRPSKAGMAFSEEEEIAGNTTACSAMMS